MTDSKLREALATLCEAYLEGNWHEDGFDWSVQGFHPYRPVPFELIGNAWETVRRAALLEDQGSGPVGGGKSNGQGGKGIAPVDGSAAIPSERGAAPTAKCPNPECWDGFLYGPVDQYGFRARVGDCPDCNGTGKRDAPDHANKSGAEAVGVEEARKKRFGAGDWHADSVVQYDNGFADGAAWQASQTRDGWRPIETAPKDGTEVLLWIVGDEDSPRKGRWQELFETVTYDGVEWGKWCVSYGRIERPDYPTHWMPTPPQPQGE